MTVHRQAADSHTLPLPARRISDSPAMLSITPLQPSLGAEVAGVDLRVPLTDELRGVLHKALLRRRVLFLRDQVIGPSVRRRTRCKPATA